MKNLIITILLALVAASPAAAQDGWISMFDGKTLDGWKASELPENWVVEDGLITGKGARSHLFWMTEKCTDCEFKAEVKISDKGNSGMYFRAKFGPGWPEGYEAQVNSTHTDWKKTGSLYNFVDIKKILVPPDTWYTEHIIAKGNHIIIKINGETVVDYVDEKNTHMEGHLALQQHDPGSHVSYRNLQMRPIK
jgi:3-keto-disaccharide hydrolase